MKSFKNHFSLIIALLSVLFSIQIFIIVDRSIDAYRENLTNNYSVIIVSQKKLKDTVILNLNNTIRDVNELSVDKAIKKLNTGISAKNIELLKISLPKFYKLTLKKYPSPKQIKKLKKDLLKNKTVIKVEDFTSNHSKVYKLLLLFKNVISVFSVVVFVITMLLIFKELRIWQFKHTERMNIMGLFGAPVWLRSAVLFRLAIVDAILASILVVGLFLYISTLPWILDQFNSIGINVIIFNFVDDSILIFVSAITISILLASMIVLGHKEEV